MIRSCALLAILFIIKVTSDQVEECPSCCHHTFTETNITSAGARRPFWDCTDDENLAIHAARCISECAYNLPLPKINPDYTPWPLLNVRNLTRTQQGMLFRCFGRCMGSFNPDYCSNCNDDDTCISICAEFNLLLNDTMNVNQPSPPMHPAFYISGNGGYQINIEPRDSYVPDNTMDGGSGKPMNAQNLTYGFIIKLHTPTANKTSYCPLVDNINFGTYIRDIDHLCTPTQLSYAVVNRYGVSDYSPINTECLGNYTVSDVRGFDDIETCVSKDLRPGFEGHNVVEISWETNSTHESHCIGEYIIDINPSLMNDNECRNRETVSAVVDKHARSHRFLSSDPAIRLFNDSCEYDMVIHGRRIPELLGYEEVIINATTQTQGCDENDIRPSILKLNVQPSKQSDFSYRVTLEWIVEYNIDVLESLDFFRIIVSTESLLRNNSFFEENNIPAHDTNALIRPAYPTLNDFIYRCNVPFQHYNCVEACAAMNLSSNATCLPSCDNVTRYKKELDHIFLPNTMENYIIMISTKMTETSTICHPNDIVKIFNFTTVTCSMKGQIHTADCFGTNATCSNPNPPMICDFPQCVCPRGQVIDEASNACINGTECRRGCNIRRISGNANYNNNRRRLTLKFSPNRQGREAFFQCRIDDQRFRTCTSPMLWRNLNLRRGRHTVTVRGSCTYNGAVTSTSSRRHSFRVRN